MSMPILPNSYLPLVISMSLLLIALGVVGLLHTSTYALYMLILGLSILVASILNWFRIVIKDSQTILQGNVTFDRSMRVGMIWFIFTEVMFFAGLFGVLFYIRTRSLPQLGGLVESEIMTHTLLWPSFKAQWPLLASPDGMISGITPVEVVGIPALNTIILLCSGLTITFSHYALKAANYKNASRWLLATIGLGAVFLGFQVLEYQHAISQGLTLQSTIYGNIFYLMTGFHGLHVFLGAVILIAIYIRMVRGELTPQAHFGFEASAWYWHFVDVVWLMLFIFVYWI
ncbi:cytochrome c oxidase subunit 3 [Gammaproteobacteria bacterium]|nr:cytochrome c oxidase subunit 3 [Gammaproteobacteria bacterium]